MGFDDIDALRMIDYRISVVDRDAREQGREAIRVFQGWFRLSQEMVEEEAITIPYRR